MNEQDLFILADTTLLGVINQIHSDQWTMTMPPDFSTWDPNTTITLREVINYHAYDEAWVPDTLAGKTIEDVGKAHDGDLLGDDPKQSFARYVDAAVAPSATSTTSTGSSTSPTATSPPANTSGTSPASAVCASTTSPRPSASTATCHPTSPRASGTRSHPTPKNGAPSASSAPRSMSPRTLPSRTASSA